MSKTKSVWESRFYALKHRLEQDKDFTAYRLANQAIDAKGENKDLNTTVYWQNKGQFEMIKELIKGAKYIETEMYF